MENDVLPPAQGKISDEKPAGSSSRITVTFEWPGKTWMLAKPIVDFSDRDFATS